MSSPPLKKRNIFHGDILPRSTNSTAGEDVMTMSHERSKSTTNVNVVSIAKTIGDAVNSLETHFQCSICFDVICKSQRIPECGHRFCRDCIKTSINKCKRECPVCRCPVISTRNLREEKSFDDLILSFRGVQKIIKEQIDQLQGLQEMIPPEINSNHDLLSPREKPKATREPDLFDDESDYSTEILPLCLRNPPIQKSNVQKAQSDASRSSKSENEDDDEDVDASDEEILPVSKRQQAKQNSTSRQSLQCKTAPRRQKDDSSRKKSEDEDSEFSDFSSNSSSDEEEDDFRPISSLKSSSKRLSSGSLSTSSKQNLQDDNSTSSKESHYSKIEATRKKPKQNNIKGQRRARKNGMPRKRLVIELLDSSEDESMDSSKNPPTMKTKERDARDVSKKDQIVKQQASSSKSPLQKQRTKDTEKRKSDSTQLTEVIFDSSSEDEDSDENSSDINSIEESYDNDHEPLEAKSTSNNYRPIRRRSKQPEWFGSPVSADDDVIENILNSPGNVLTWTNEGSNSENASRFPKRRRRTRKVLHDRRERRHRKPERFGEIADSKEVDKFISSPENVLKWKITEEESDNEFGDSSNEESNGSKDLSTTPKHERSSIDSKGRPESYLQRWSDRKSKPTDKFTSNF